MDGSGKELIAVRSAVMLLLILEQIDENVFRVWIDADLAFAEV